MSTPPPTVKTSSAVDLAGPDISRSGAGTSLGRGRTWPVCKRTCGTKYQRTGRLPVLLSLPSSIVILNLHPIPVWDVVFLPPVAAGHLLLLAADDLSGTGFSPSAVPSGLKTYCFDSFLLLVPQAHPSSRANTGTLPLPDPLQDDCTTKRCPHAIAAFCSTSFTVSHPLASLAASTETACPRLGCLLKERPSPASTFYFLP